jgi:hypothetical protein
MIIKQLLLGELFYLPFSQKYKKMVVKYITGCFFMIKKLLRILFSINTILSIRNNLLLLSNFLDNAYSLP